MNVHELILLVLCLTCLAAGIGAFFIWGKMVGFWLLVGASLFGLALALVKAL